jgi:O-antigen ligase
MEISYLTLAALALLGAFVVAICVNRPRTGLGILLLSFIPAPLFPSPGFEWLFYGFAGFTLLVLLGWLVRLTFRLAPFRPYATGDKIGFSLTFWLLLCALGLPLSLIFNQGLLSERLYFYAKGLVPFVYVLVYFVVRALPIKVKEAKRVLDYLLVIAIAFAIITFGIYGVTHTRVISFYLPLAFPFIVLGADVAFVHMLMVRSRRVASLWSLLIGILTIAVLLNFTKAQVIVLALSIWLMVFLVSRHDVYRMAVRRCFVLVACFAILAAGSAIFSSGQNQASFTELLKARLNDDSSGQTRLAEITEAFSQFARSPVVGKGIGHQMERDAMGESLTSGYVHNQVAYTAMTMGVAGLLLFGLLVGSWASLLMRFRQIPQDLVATLAMLHGCVFTLVAYAQMFATFRTIQHNLLLGILLALIVRLTPECDSVRVRTAPSTPIPSIARVG